MSVRVQIERISSVWKGLLEGVPPGARQELGKVTRIVLTLGGVLAVANLAHWGLPGPASVPVFLVMMVGLWIVAKNGLLENWFEHGLASRRIPRRTGKNESEDGRKSSGVGSTGTTGRPVPNRDEMQGLLRDQVIGQDEAIALLVRQVRGKLASSSPKPLVILLAGPTGTGKTELAKATARALGVELVRFDMGEFADKHSAWNLFGSAKGYLGSADGGALPNALRRSSHLSVLLFDEVEKAHRDLWPMLLAFFDEGRAADSLGSTNAPKNTICLLTSNLAAEEVGRAPEQAKELLRRTGYFPQEFLGRINKVIPLGRLNKVDNERLIQRLLGRMGSEYGLRIALGREAMDALVEATSENAQRYGGRGMMEKLTDLLTDDLLDLREQGHREIFLKVVRQSSGVRVCACARTSA